MADDARPTFYEGIDLVLLDELPDDAELAGPRPASGFVWSIKALGVLSPIICEQLPDGAILVRSGKRRVKAARIARDELGTMAEADPDDELLLANYQRSQRIPVQWLERSNGTGALVDIGTNLQQPNPFSDLEAIEEVLAAARVGRGEPGGADLASAVELKEVARRTGLPYATVVKRYELHPLPPAVRQAVARGTLAMGVAQRIAKLGERQRQELADRIAAGERIGNGDVTALTRARTQAAAAALDTGFLDDDGAAAPAAPLHPLALLAARGVEAKLTGPLVPVRRREFPDGYEWQVTGPDGATYYLTLGVMREGEEVGDGASTTTDDAAE